MDILFVLKLLLEKKWYLISMPILCAAASYFLTMDIKADYKSTAKLATQFTTDDKINITNDKANLRDADVKFNNLVEMMNSELIVSMVSYRLIINDLTSGHPFRKPDSEFTHYLKSPEKEKIIQVFQRKIDRFELLSNYDYFEKGLLDLLTNYGYVNWVLIKSLKIGRIEGSDFINVGCVSEDPFLSAFVVNTLCEEAIRYDNFLGSKRAEQSIHFFSNLLEEKKKALDDKSFQLAEFKKSVHTYGMTAKPADAPAGISAQETKRSELQSKIHLLKLSIASLDRRLQSNASPQNQYEINENILQLRKKINELSSTPKDATTQKKNSELSIRLQDELNKLSEIRTPGKTKAELENEKEEKEIELKVAETDLAAVESMIYMLRQNVSVESALDALQRQVDKASDEYINVLDRYNTERSKATISSTVQMVIKGQPNGHAEFPKRYLIIAAAGLASFFLCAFLVIFFEFVAPRIRTSAQLRLETGMQTIAAVSMVKKRKLKPNDLLTLQKNKSIEKFKNSLRHLRHAIEESKSHVFLFTSTSPDQGKSFLVTYLSVVLAILKKKVLIIDTNFHHNTLTQILKRKNGSGKKPEAPAESSSQQDLILSDYPNTFIRTIPLSSNLYIDGVGNSGSISTPSEVFAEKDFGKTINSLRKHYDYILLEGPALNKYSDSKELTNYVDKVIAVFSSDSVIKPSDKESISYLKNLNGKFFGAVLNQVQQKE